MFLFLPVKFTRGPLVPYPTKAPSKAMPGTTVGLANGRIWDISVLQHLLWYIRQAPQTLRITVLFPNIVQHVQSEAKLHGNLKLGKI